MNEQYLLSICIPTYNRCTFLNESLKRIEYQFKSLINEVELIVSDNCSTDNTAIIVQDYINKKLPIKYIKNIENIGPDRNIAQCFRIAKGKYVWVLGDDDFLEDGALNEIMKVLDDGDYGLIHLQTNPIRQNTQKQNSKTEYSDSRKFISTISYLITFISSNIVNRKYVEQIDFSKYEGSFFLTNSIVYDGCSFRKTEYSYS